MSETTTPRISKTGSGSILTEFLGEGTSACHDLYPDGTVVMIIRHNGVDNVFEFSSTDALQEQLSAAIRKRDALRNQLHACMAASKDLHAAVSSGRDAALARIAELEATLNKGQPTCAHCRGEIGVILTTVADQGQLTARIAELEMDKDALDWLEMAIRQTDPSQQLIHISRGWKEPLIEVKTYDGLTTHTHSKDTLREAIADARAAAGDRWIADHQSDSVRATSNPDDPNCYRK